MADPSRRAVIFDLDGVLTDTAEFHYQGWQRLADEEGVPFDRAANEALRGVARRESLLHLLGDREVGEDELVEMMERKNRYYVAFLGDMTPKDLLPGAVGLVVHAKRRGFAVAIGSSSKNARRVLDQLRLTGLFDVVADGHTVEHAKPAPDLFLAAAEALDVPPSSCVVIEDAGSGVDAALAAGMVAVGVGPDERVGHAHHRFDTVAAIDLDVVVAPDEQRVEGGPLVADGWAVVEDRHDPARAATIAARDLAANGRLGCRAILAEWSADAARPTCTVAGSWTTADGTATGQRAVPSALYARWTHDGEPVEVPAEAAVADRHVLERRFDIRYGRQCRRLAPRADAVRELVDERFVLLDGLGVAVQQQRLSALHGTRLTVVTGIDASALDAGTEPAGATVEGDVLADALTMRVAVDGWDLPVSAAHAVSLAGATVRHERVEHNGRRLLRVLDVEVGEAGSVTLTQVMVADVESGDGAHEPAALAQIARDALADGYDVLLAQHVEAWDRLWSRLDVTVDGDPIVQTALRLALYRLVAASPDQDQAGLSVWLHTRPDIARDMLIARHRALSGLPTAVVAEVAVAVGRYVQMTGDQAFLTAHGAEIVLAAARSLAAGDEAPASTAGPAALRLAADVWDRLASDDPATLATLCSRLGLSHADRAAWTELTGRASVPGHEAPTGADAASAGYDAARRGRPDDARDLLRRYATAALGGGEGEVTGTAASGLPWQAVVLGMGGVRVDDGVLELSPRLPHGWTRLTFGLAVRSCWLEVMAGPAGVALRSAAANTASVTVRAHGRELTLEPGERTEIAADDGAHADTSDG